MANEEHIKIIKQGGAAWNAWRAENPNVRPNLRGADLSRANLNCTNLSGADLSYADLGEIDFIEANLSGADLSWTNLSTARHGLVDPVVTTTTLPVSGANLTSADLNGAIFVGANLGRAILAKADLSGAFLHFANLDSANLSGTNFSRALVARTTFANNDLSTVEGLETVKHIGPSTIGVDTLFRSEGKIPEAFLRGAGIPEHFITFFRHCSLDAQ